MSTEDSDAIEQNWAGNVRFQAASFVRPRSLAELQDVVATSPVAHVLGTGHSFSEVADTSGLMISLDNMPAFVELDQTRRLVRVSAATRFGALAASLEREGFALANLGSLPHIGVAGACSTGTHGSGDANGSLSTLVRGIEFIRADGEQDEIRVADPAEELSGSVISCGALGVVHALTLAVVDTYDLRQVVYEPLPLERALANLDWLLASAYSVSLFIDWSNTGHAQVWRKELVGEGHDPARDCLGALPAKGPRHPVAGMSPDECTAQLGAPGPWNERLPHFRADGAPSAAGEELQSEFFLRRVDAAEALAALAVCRDRFAHLVQVGEVRSVAGDDLWLSPCYGRDSVAVHFTWRRDQEAVLKALELIEQVLESFAARPHWGKLFVTDPDELAERYARLPDFAALAERHDPTGKFANAFARRYLLREP